MRLGLFLILPQPAGVSQAQVFESALEDAVLAERLGFDSVWVTEHHGSAYGLAAAPSVIAGAIAARTERIAIGYAVNVSPLHHPIRLADDIATVDHLSRGRVIAGFGAGYSPVEYRQLSADFGDRHRRHHDTVATVIEHWSRSPGAAPAPAPPPAGRRHRCRPRIRELGGAQRVRPAHPGRRAAHGASAPSVSAMRRNARGGTAGALRSPAQHLRGGRGGGH